VFWRDHGARLTVQTAAAEHRNSPDHWINVLRLTSWRRGLIDRHGDEHVVLQNKRLMMTLTARGVGLLDGPCSFSVRIDGRSGVADGARRLRLFDHFLNEGSPAPRELINLGHQHARLYEALVGLDGDLAGIRYRDIAAALFGEQTAAEDWGRGQSTLKQKVRRTVNRGHNMANGGYLKLLK
jgi:Uncharacterized conserved protein (DUF2285)